MLDADALLLCNGWFDADGKGTEADLELVAILQNVKTLSTGDFSFI